MEPTDRPTFRAQYARRLIRERLYEELHRRHDAYGQPGCIAPPGHPFLGGGPTTSAPHHPSELPHEPKEGLARGKVDKGALKFCIVGAGIAGLYTAMILDECGVKYDFFEASERVGGRVYTKKFGGGNEYYDIGAMRFPKIGVMHK